MGYVPPSGVLAYFPMADFQSPALNSGRAVHVFGGMPTLQTVCFLIDSSSFEWQRSCPFNCIYYMCLFAPRFVDQKSLIMNKNRALQKEPSAECLVCAHQVAGRHPTAMLQTCFLRNNTCKKKKNTWFGCTNESYMQNLALPLCHALRRRNA